MDGAGVGGTPAFATGVTCVGGRTTGPPVLGLLWMPVEGWTTVPSGVGAGRAVGGGGNTGVGWAQALSASATTRPMILIFELNMALPRPFVVPPIDVSCLTWG